MSVIYYNSQFINKEDLCIKGTDRAFNYGDGFFESVRIINATVFNLSAHLKRIDLAFKVLRIIPFKDDLRIILDKLITLNKIQNANAKIKLSRGGVGKYLPDSSAVNVLITIEELDTGFTHNTPIKLCAYREQLKAKGSLSNIKSSNALVSVLGAIYAREKKIDNSILFNSNFDVIETSNSNLFIVKDDVVITPPISDGCVAGTMRNLLLSLDKNIKERTLNINDLMLADEVFVTNAISGITSIESIKDENTFKGFTFDRGEALQQELINLSLGL